MSRSNQPTSRPTPDEPKSPRTIPETPFASTFSRQKDLDDARSPAQDRERVPEFAAQDRERVPGRPAQDRDADVAKNASPSNLTTSLSGGDDQRVAPVANGAAHENQTVNFYATISVSADVRGVDDPGIQNFWKKFGAQKLPTFRQNEPCQETLELRTLWRQCVDAPSAEFSLQDVDDALFQEYGITCRLNAGALVLSGTPTQTMFGRLRITLKVNGRPLDEKTASIRFNILPDISSLWKNLPSPAGPYPVPDELKFAFEIPNTDKIVVAASQRGRSHEHKGSFRDDSYYVRGGAKNDWTFLAVADGAGSAKYSRQGARTVCKTLVDSWRGLFQKNQDYVQNALRSVAQAMPRDADVKICTCEADAAKDLYDIFYAALYDAYEKLRAEANEANAQETATRDGTTPGKSPGKPKISLSDFHTTLLCCAIRKYEKGWIVVSYWIGDGMFAIYRPNGQDRVLTLGEPDGGEYSGQTRFFTMPSEISETPIRKRMRVALLSDFDAIVMATDGVADPYFELASYLEKMEAWQNFWKSRGKNEIFEGVFAPNASPIDRAERLLAGLRFQRAKNFDDRTLLLALAPERFV